jgi:hypothetical protein
MDESRRKDAGEEKGQRTQLAPKTPSSTTTPIIALTFTSWSGKNKGATMSSNAGCYGWKGGKKGEGRMRYVRR